VGVAHHEPPSYCLHADADDLFLARAAWPVAIFLMQRSAADRFLLLRPSPTAVAIRRGDPFPPHPDPLRILKKGTDFPPPPAVSLGRVPKTWSNGRENALLPAQVYENCI